jgi:cobyric acid synthase CobQ
MIQGTGSDVGKSVLVSALCRLFVRQGLRVAPFKAQNMSNNSFVTPDGREIGRAQAVQAAACRIAPRADFNPVLIKPSDDHRAQLVVDGQVAGELVASDFGRIRRECAKVVEDAFARLSAEFDLVILEGAGSAAEVNLSDYDIVNMRMAHMAHAPVLLVGDIDRGGVLAALVGTMDLLPASDASLVKGFVINKFRGDLGLLMPGVRVVEERTGLRCLGVLPYSRELRLPQEDSLAWEELGSQTTRIRRPDTLRIGVVDLPCISNFTDVDSLASEMDVQIVRVSGPYVDTQLRLDVLMFPGTKNTPQALHYVTECGLDRLARSVLTAGGMVIGICGGYQILGRRIRDPFRVESNHMELEALGLLDAETCFASEKVTMQVTGTHCETGHRIEGYEVHMGRTVTGPGVLPFLEIQEPGGTRPEGAVSEDGRIVATYVHGVFDAPLFRRSFLNRLRRAKGWPELALHSNLSLDQRLDEWADVVGAHLDMRSVATIIEQAVNLCDSRDRN